MSETGNDWGWFRNMTPEIIRRNPYLAIMDKDRVPVRIIHSSGEYDRSPEAERRAIRSYMPRADIITMTEKQSDKHKRAFRGWDGWDGINIGRGGEDECAALINTRVYDLRAFSASPMSKHPVPRRNGQINHALNISLIHKATSAPLRISVAHTRSGVESEWNEHQGDAYRADMRGWQRMKADVWIGDLNLDMHRQWTRKYVNDIFHPARLNWRVGDMPMNGTHGSRLIDGAISKLPIKQTHLLSDDNSSDHRPFKVTYWLDAKGKR